MRLLICAGGTGGGVYPALAVLQYLVSEDEGAIRASTQSGSALDPDPQTIDVLWVGSEGGMEEGLMARAGLAFEAIPAAGLHGVGWRALPGNLVRLMKGYAKSRQIIHRYRPDVLFFTGGYVAVPMALAGRKVPSLLYVPDIEPGLAIKTLARLANHIAVTAEQSRDFFSARSPVSVTGYPTRASLGAWDKAAARKALQISNELPVLLVLGGSKGARSINRAVVEILPDLLSEMQVIHLTGQLDWAEIESERDVLAQRLANPLWVERYRPFAYLHDEIGAALAAADLAVSRAGASSLGEFPLFGLPAILVPYPFAWRYQKVNAQYLERNGAAMTILDEALSKKLLPTIQELIHDDRKRKSMSLAMQSLYQPSAAESISQILFSLGQERLGRIDD